MVKKRKKKGYTFNQTAIVTPVFGRKTVVKDDGVVAGIDKAIFNHGIGLSKDLVLVIVAAKRIER